MVMLFADDFVGISNSSETYRIDIVHKYCNRRKLKVNVDKSAVIVFSRSSVGGSWMRVSVPLVSNYCYLGIHFASHGGWKFISNTEEN